MRNEIIRLEDIIIKADEVTLLNYLNMHIFEGEIMGLLCVNAYGIAELIQLLIYNPPIHYGRVYFKDILVNSYNFRKKVPNKVTVIEQQSHLIDDLTVAENIFILRKGLKKFVINKRILNSQLQKFTDEIGVSISGGTYVAGLNPYERCVVELLKAVIAGAQLIVTRDLSNYVSKVDMEKLYTIMRYYCKKGLSFLCIGNHHQEMFKICSRMSIIRDGRILKVLGADEFTEEAMEPYAKEYYQYLRNLKQTLLPKKEMLSFQGVVTEHLKNFSFTAAAGDCTILLDINNSVLTDIMSLMNGTTTLTSGKIVVDNREYTCRQAKLAIRNGIAFIQERPTQSMIFSEMSYIDNLCFLLEEKTEPIHLNHKIKKSVLKEYKKYVGKDIYENNISCIDVKSLYNIVYYRIHLCCPKIVFIVQPFAGADMYHRFYIIELITRLKERGITVIILAVNLSDSFLVADKLIIIENGTYSNEYNCSEFLKL